MANLSRGWIVFGTMLVAVSLFFVRGESGIAHAQSTSCGTYTSTHINTEYAGNSEGTGCSTSTSTSSSTSTSTSTSSSTPTPTTTGADSSGNSINDLAKQRFNQMITNRVLGTVLLGINEQVNCSDCVSAFGSAGSFSAGIHGRKSITDNLSLLAGIP